MTITAVTERSSRSDQRAKLLKSLKLPGILLGIFAVLSGIIALATPERSDLRFAPDNPSASGAMALAEVLKREGVNITFTRDYDTALELSQPGTTVLMADPPYWMDFDLSRLYSSGADLVLLSPSDDVVYEASRVFGTEFMIAGSYGETSTQDAQCELPAALAAERIRNTGTGFESIADFSESGVPANISMCFPMDWGAHLVQITDSNDATLTLFDDSAAFSNGVILENGQAALALHLLGANSELVWYLPYADNTMAQEESNSGWPLPFTLFATVALISILFIAIWQGRRLGPVVSEQLPVVVKSSETTLGRGKLYRAAGARGRAAAALRAGSASRIGARLGIAAGSTPEHFARTVSMSTNRTESDVYNLFYGPAPSNDAALTALAQQLSTLESEINA